MGRIKLSESEKRKARIYYLTKPERVVMDKVSRIIRKNDLFNDMDKVVNKFFNKIDETTEKIKGGKNEKRTVENNRTGRN